MPLTWAQRVTRLRQIIGRSGPIENEEPDGQAVDEYLASNSRGVREEAENLRFNDEDLGLIGRLAVGQFGTVDLVRCRLDSRVYVRKTIEKRTALRAHGQCSPQLERDILIKALKVKSCWAPHILCAFQTESSLKLVMEYGDGGNLWEVIESSPEGKIPRLDLQWWAPQIVSAIGWCHSQGFVHRDIKPHNFVLTSSSHLLLVDFGSAAPLLPPSPSGVQLVPKEHCLFPCGTCDYISPDILQCHEEALVALELQTSRVSLEHEVITEDVVGVYGRETDWWSFGAMMYEMAFGVAPFYADDVGHTYMKIVEHRTSLRLSAASGLSDAALSLLAGVLCDKERRLGRHSVAEIKEHQFFQYVDWDKIHLQTAPGHLCLPQFTYSTVASDKLESRIPHRVEDQEEQFSEPFPFSGLFQSSRSISGPSNPLITPPNTNGMSSTATQASATFVGFSWGPRLDAFPTSPDFDLNATSPIIRPLLNRELMNGTPRSIFPSFSTAPLLYPQTFRTPVRISPKSQLQGHTVSILRTGTGRRMREGRPLSDREAMRQLVDCVGMSAHKKIIESGRKPRLKSTSGQQDFEREVKLLMPNSRPISDHVDERDMSTTTSETESQPPSPTPRPGSALSRSGLGGRSTPSLTAGGFTPIPTPTESGTAASVKEVGISGGVSQENSTLATPFDRMLLEVERKHDSLLAELASLEEDVGSVASRLKNS